jgi:hypothetical protein
MVPWVRCDGYVLESRTVLSPVLSSRFLLMRQRRVGDIEFVADA